jgi:nucleoside diphosphate kinase
MKKSFMINVLIAFIAFISFSSSVNAEGKMEVSKDYMPSLITDTPLEGRMLAMTIVRKTIGAIQTNKEAKHRVRKDYAEDPALLMRAVELVNLEFKIIAEANNYWRK